MEYVAEFRRLSRYALGMIVDEQEKCARFEFGLIPKLMIQVALLQERVFKVLVEKTKIVKKLGTLSASERSK